MTSVLDGLPTCIGRLVECSLLETGDPGLARSCGRQESARRSARRSSGLERGSRRSIAA